MVESSGSAEEIYLPEFANWPTACESTAVIVECHSEISLKVSNKVKEHIKQQELRFFSRN